MIKIAVYGKGGIGKSTTVSNLSAALSEKGLRVMQIGCDPKADSTVLLTHGEKMPTALQLMRERKNDFTLSDMAREGFGGVVCVEAGGPTPGLGCAGRGIVAALDKLAEKGAYEVFSPDLVIYDVLGDVVCGGMADGATLFDTRHFTDAPKNCTVCYSTDEEKFANMLVDILSRAR